VKLAEELGKKDRGEALYLLDEPTTGLHSHDERKLIEVLHRLTDAGNTVVVVEHELDLVKNADHIIDLGPEGGEGGGEVVANGTPEHVARQDASHTGRYLRDHLDVDLPGPRAERETERAELREAANERVAELQGEADAESDPETAAGDD
jgi:excinuclease ABC subunit A